MRRALRALLLGLPLWATFVGCEGADPGDAGGSETGGLHGSSDDTSDSGGSFAAGGLTGVGGAMASGGLSVSAGGSGLSSGSGGTSSSGGGSSVEFGAPVTLSGRQLLVGGQPFHIRGVCYNPVPKGSDHPPTVDHFLDFAATDIPLMQAAGINVVRTYEPVTDVRILDALSAASIYLINSVYPWGGSDVSVVTERVNAVKDHPAILMWYIGNEWNYNGFYVDLSASESLERLKQAAALVRQADPNHPVATVYGELPSQSLVDELSEWIDVWGINVYRGIGFGDLFSDFAARSSQPMFVAEYGADAWDSRGEGSYGPQAQAEATQALTQELLTHSSALTESGVTLGGTIFEWADEWWKAGNLDVHDHGGSAPGGGPYPDSTFNEEWWGIVDIDRNPRPAYDVLQALHTNH